MNSFDAGDIIEHRNFRVGLNAAVTLCRACSGGSVLAVLGPTRAGKSVIFRELHRTLQCDTAGHRDGEMPVIALTIATSQDGRIAPKHLTLKALKAIEHPTYRHFGELDEQDHPLPSRGRDETSMRIALEAGLDARVVKYTLLDEAHHLTHTRDARIRATVLESIKCLTAIDRTLVLVGGYELAYSGLFDSAHFAGRLTCVELSPYREVEDDMLEWLSILKTLSLSLVVKPANLLLDHAQSILAASSGSFGLARKIVWRAKAICESAGRPIAKGDLIEAFPMRHEHDAIRRDIECGQAALERFSSTAIIRSGGPGKPATSSPLLKPFKRKPNRRAILPLEVADQ